MKSQTLSSLALVSGYVLGQGSVFLYQVTAKSLGYGELVGIAVLLVSVLSFGLQFADIGGAAYISQRIATSRLNDVASYIAARAAVALVSGVAFSIALTQTSVAQHLPVLTLLAVPALSVICAINRNTVLEAMGRYGVVAFLAATPWVCFALILTGCTITGWSLQWVPVALVLTAVVVTVASWKASAVRLLWRNLSQRRVAGDMTYFLPPLTGQLWGRLIVVLLLGEVGLEQLGDFGIVRYLQVAVLLGSGFLMRPVLRSWAVDYVGGSRSVSVLTLFARSRIPTLGLCLGPFMGALIILMLPSTSGLAHWTPLLFLCTIQALSAQAAQMNQVLLRRSVYIRIEQMAVVANAITFMLLLSHSALWAIVLAESAQCILILIAHEFFRRNP